MRVQDMTDARYLHWLASTFGKNDPVRAELQKRARNMQKVDDADARLASFMLKTCRVALDYVQSMTVNGETTREKALRVALQHAIRKAEGGEA